MSGTHLSKINQLRWNISMRGHTTGWHLDKVHGSYLAIMISRSPHLGSEQQLYVYSRLWQQLFGCLQCANCRWTCSHMSPCSLIIFQPLRTCLYQVNDCLQLPLTADRDEWGCMLASPQSSSRQRGLGGAKAAHACRPSPECFKKDHCVVDCFVPFSSLPL